MCLHGIMCQANRCFRWLYTLFLMMDANFKLKSKDHKAKDVDLGHGWAYYVEDIKFKKHVAEFGYLKEEDSTCSAEYNAIKRAGLSRNGYLASGVSAVLCGRHSLARKNGVADLQKGER